MGRGHRNFYAIFIPGGRFLTQLVCGVTYAEVVGGPGLRSLYSQTMIKILVPVDGSACALAAVRHAAFLYREGGVAEVVLLNVQPALERSRAGAFHSLERLRGIECSEGEAALSVARDILDDSGVPYTAIIGLGGIAQVIAQTAEGNDCDEIVLGVGLWSRIKSCFGGGLPAGVMRRTAVPLTVVKAGGPAAEPARDARLPARQKHACQPPRLVVYPPGN